MVYLISISAIKIVENSIPRKSLTLLVQCKYKFFQGWHLSHLSKGFDSEHVDLLVRKLELLGSQSHEF